LLAAGDGTGLITLYDTKSWQPVGEPLRKHESSVLSLKFSLEGHWLVSGGTDGLVLVWDVPKRKLHRTFEGHGTWIWDVAISADSRAVASVGRPAKSGAPTLFLWNLDEHTSIEDVSVPAGTLVSVAFNENPNSQMLVTGDPSGKVLVWNLIPWRYLHRAPVPSNKIEVGASSSSAVWGLAFVPGEPFAIVTGRDIGIINRNLINPHHNPSKITLTRETLGVTGNNFGVFRIDVSPDGKLVAAAGQDGLVSLWNASEMSSVFRHSARVTSLQILDGEAGRVMSLDENGGLYRWDYTRQKILNELSLDTGEVLRSAIQPDGNRAVTGYNDGKILFWDAGTGQKLSEHTDHTARITSLVFDRDGKRLASSDANGLVVLWDVTAKALEPVATFSDPQKSAVQVLRFSTDGSTLVGGGCGVPILFPAPECSQGALYIWDANSKLKLRHQPLPGKSGFVWSMAFNPKDPAELAVGTRDGTVTVWNLSTRKSGLSFRVGESDITSLAFSPDGQLLAVGADSYKVFLFNAHTGQLFGQAFREHDGSTTALVFSPDGETLVSASIDSTIVLHDMRVAKWEEHACSLANRNLLRAEWDLYIGAAQPYGEICPGFVLEPEPTVSP
ncbi:MAG TPA: WD40 repeat domain-containing protein, partial [Anaerolineales bacterium]|nr:WD40 repeat domain-containing protein [Anaerolineales bacterium]